MDFPRFVIVEDAGLECTDPPSSVVNWASARPGAARAQASATTGIAILKLVWFTFRILQKERIAGDIVSRALMKVRGFGGRHFRL